MKIFDSWIEKQFYKRNPDIKALMNPMKVTDISKEKIKPIRCLTMMMLNMNDDNYMPENTKKEMLARQFLPLIADQMNVRREIDAERNQVVYHASLSIVPRKENDHAL